VNEIWHQYIEMVAKLFLLQFVFFGCGFVRPARNDFHRNSITLQIISLAFLASLEKS